MFVAAHYAHRQTLKKAALSFKDKAAHKRTISLLRKRLANLRLHTPETSMENLRGPLPETASPWYAPKINFIRKRIKAIIFHKPLAVFCFAFHGYSINSLFFFYSISSNRVLRMLEHSQDTLHILLRPDFKVQNQLKDHPRP